MPEQYLPTYKHDFLKDERWRVKKSPHYVFYYFPDTVAEKEIDYIIERQERGYEKIVDFLGIIPPEKPIEYYIYSDPKIKEKLMGDDWYAQSISDEFRVHILYTEEDKPIGEHEDTHLLSLPWGYTIGFLEEGLAEFMVDVAWDGKSHNEHVKSGYADNIYPEISKLFSHNNWMDMSDADPMRFYSLAGSFVKFLISNFGKEKFEKLYKETDREFSLEKNVEIFESIYGMPAIETEQEFKKWLNES